jgi:hypothetical protein
MIQVLSIIHLGRAEGRGRPGPGRGCKFTLDINIDFFILEVA